MLGVWKSRVFFTASPAISLDLATKVADIFQEHLGFKAPEDGSHPYLRGASKLTATGEPALRRLPSVTVVSTWFDRLDALAAARKWSAFPLKQTLSGIWLIHKAMLLPLAKKTLFLNSSSLSLPPHFAFGIHHQPKPLQVLEPQRKVDSGPLLHPLEPDS